MRGFFSSEELRRPNRAVNLGKPLSCYSCGLLKSKVTLVEPHGGNALHIMVLLPEPISANQINGGPSGTYLKRCLAKCGVDLDRDCLIVPVVKCKPLDSEGPSDHQIQCCSSFLKKVVKKYQPILILAFGMEAVKSLIPVKDLKSISSIETFRGELIPSQDLQTWICPMWHPSIPMKKRDIGDLSGEVLFLRDLNRALGILDMRTEVEQEYFKTDYTSLVDTYTDPYKIAEVVDSFTNGDHGDLVSFDYETTGLKPQKEGHNVRTGSLCGNSRAASFLLFDKAWTQEQLDLVDDAWIRFLQSPIKKTAHNLKFEVIWSTVIYGVEPVNAVWCSMVASHIICTTPGTHGLKFRAFVELGVVPYSGPVDEYLKTKDDSGNGMNRVFQAPVHDLLLYGGLDALLQRKLALKQMEQIGYEI